MIFQCRRCKKDKDEEAVWVPYVELGVTGHVPYCLSCYDILKGLMNDLHKVNEAPNSSCKLY